MTFLYILWEKHSINIINCNYYIYIYISSEI